MGGLCAGKRQGQRWDVVGKDPRGREEAGMSPHWQVRVLSPYFLIVSGALWFLRLLAVIGFALSVSGGGVPSEGWGSHPLSLPTEGQGCTAYDVAVNSDFYRRMQVGGGAAGRSHPGRDQGPGCAGCAPIRCGRLAFPVPDPREQRESWTPRTDETTPPRYSCSLRAHRSSVRPAQNLPLSWSTRPSVIWPPGRASTSYKPSAPSHAGLFAVPTASGPLHNVPSSETHCPQILAVPPSPPSALLRCHLLGTPSPTTPAGTVPPPSTPQPHSVHFLHAPSHHLL